ncbi:MAG: DUF4007 family protein [Paludibacteraceae bacterium]|nr:DUF4007 family protein [Paludibacteraceae bacterium]
MVINKHGSFYLRSGWGTKILQAVKEDALIFSPNNEQAAVDNIGLGRVMIKALRYWSEAMGLTIEEKTQQGIKQVPTTLFSLIEKNDKYFQKRGSLLLLHRNLALNKENATAWYWLFNEFTQNEFDKDVFSDGFHSYLAVNGMAVKKDAVEKEFNCVKNTYIGEQHFDIKNIMDEDTYPFLAPLGLLKVNEKKKLEKVPLQKGDIPLELLLFSIAMDNLEESTSGKQVSVDKLMEEQCQVGRYFNIRYTRLIESLLEAENKKYINLNNNFGNRYIEFLDIDYSDLQRKYYLDKER